MTVNSADKCVYKHVSQHSISARFIFLLLIGICLRISIMTAPALHADSRQPRFEILQVKPCGCCDH